MTTGTEPRADPEQVSGGATAVPRPPAHPGRTAAILVAAWFFLASITPSLIPRGWLMQGVASGLSAAYGYGLGLVIAWCWRKLRDALGIRITMAPVPARWLRRAGWAALAVVVVLVWLRSLRWNRDTAWIVGKSPPGPLTLVLGLAATVLVFVLVILAARGLRALTRRGSKLGQRFLHPWVATALAAVLVATVVLVLSDSLVYRKAMGYAADKAAVVNGVTPEGRTPTCPARSRCCPTGAPRPQPAGRCCPRSRPSCPAAPPRADPGCCSAASRSARTAARPRSATRPTCSTASTAPSGSARPTSPAGHGHRYQDELVPAWAGVLGLDPDGDYGRIEQAIARDYRPV